MGGLSLGRWIKARVYPKLPSLGRKWHEKRRKGLAYRYFPEDGLECQQEQDRCFWRNFLHPEKGGRFLEIGGDGVVGSHTLGLELIHGWQGTVWEPGKIPRERAARVRKCGVEEVWGKIKPEDRPDLLAIHRPKEFPEVWGELADGRLRPPWVVVENPGPDPHWARRLEGAGYRLRLFLCDDEYFGLRDTGG